MTLAQLLSTLKLVSTMFNLASKFAQELDDAMPADFPGKSKMDLLIAYMGKLTNLGAYSQDQFNSLWPHVQELVEAFLTLRKEHAQTTPTGDTKQ